MQTLTAAAARRLAVVAQGLNAPRPTVTPDRRHLRRVLRHTSLLQIDSVNVLARAHYLPSFSRLGPYPTTMLDRMAYRDHELFEYWGHEASLLPIDLHPLLRWRMARAAAGLGTWQGVARIARERPEYVEEVYAEVRDRGPISAGELATEEVRNTTDWGWNWTDVEDRPGVPVLDRADRGGQPPQLRASLRRGRAGDPVRSAGSADSGRGGCAPRAAAGCRPGSWGGHRR